MLVGEIPEDREDRDGRPFVGPAGLLLDQALAAAQVPCADVYITNAVKHFKWEPRAGAGFITSPMRGRSLRVISGWRAKSPSSRRAWLSLWTPLRPRLCSAGNFAWPSCVARLSPPPGALPWSRRFIPPQSCASPSARRGNANAKFFCRYRQGVVSRARARRIGPRLQGAAGEL